MSISGQCFLGLTSAQIEGARTWGGNYRLLEMSPLLLWVFSEPQVIAETTSCFHETCWNPLCSHRFVLRWGPCPRSSLRNSGPLGQLFPSLSNLYRWSPSVPDRWSDNMIVSTNTAVWAIENLARQGVQAEHVGQRSNQNNWLKAALRKCEGVFWAEVHTVFQKSQQLGTWGLGSCNPTLHQRNKPSARTSART